MAAKFSTSIRCGHCGNFAPMQVEAKHRASRCHAEEGGRPYYGTEYRLLTCLGCRKVSLTMQEFDDADCGPSNYDVTVLFPQTPSQISGLPDSVSAAYTAAISVSKVDANAFAVMLGRVLDHVCKDRSAKGKDLFGQFENLAERGEIPQQLLAVAHALRALRNIGAHANLGELTCEEIPVLSSLCRAVLEYVYSAPAMVRKAQSLLDESRAVTKSEGEDAEPVNA